MQRKVKEVTIRDYKIVLAFLGYFFIRLQRTGLGDRGNMMQRKALAVKQLDTVTPYPNPLYPSTIVVLLLFSVTYGLRYRRCSSNDDLHLQCV